MSFERLVWASLVLAAGAAVGCGGSETGATGGGGAAAGGGGEAATGGGATSTGGGTSANGGGGGTAGGSAGGSGGGAGGEPIDAPPNQWTWVDFPESRCLHGDPTGIGVNPYSGSDELVVFLQGGGFCTEDCWGDTPDAKVGTPTHYTKTDFEADTDLGWNGKGGQLPIVRANADNPFAKENLAFIPYCTGDLHAGTRTNPEGGNTTYFYGAKDLDLFLTRIKATFPNMKRIIVAGSSAGGGGATLNYAKIHTAFGVRADLSDDSFPPIDGSLPFAPIEAIWGLVPPAGCSTCTTLTGLHAFNRAIDPKARFAYAANQYDPVISGFFYGDGHLDDYHAAIEQMVTRLATEPETRTFIVDNPESAPTHVVGNKKQNYAAFGSFLTLMESDSADWKSVREHP